MNNFNKLSEAELERLVLLAEEAGSVVKAVTNIIRYGYDWSDPSIAGTNNKHVLEMSIGHLWIALEFLTAMGEIDQESIHRFMYQKSIRIDTQLSHQSLAMLKELRDRFVVEPETGEEA